MDALATTKSEEVACQGRGALQDPPLQEPPIRAEFRTHALVNALRFVSPSCTKVRGSLAPRPWAWLNTACSEHEIYGYNGQAWRRASAGWESADPPVHFAVGFDPRLLHRLLDDTLAERVVLTYSRGAATLRVEAGSSVYTIPAHPQPWTLSGNSEDPAARELPWPVSAGQELELPWAELLGALRLVAGYAVTESSTGAVHYTNGVWLEYEVDAGLHVLATDGHRLAQACIAGAPALGAKHENKRSVSVENADGTVSLKCQSYTVDALLCSAKAVQQLLKQATAEAAPDRVVLEKGGVGVGHSLVLTWPESALRLPLLDVSFPDWRRALPPAPPDPTVVLRVGADKLRQACWRLSRIAQLPGPYEAPVRLALERGDLVLSVQQNDASAKERVAAEYDTPGGRAEDFAFAINAAYLHDVLRPLTGVVRLAFETDHSPVRITADCAPGFEAVIMPVRVD